MFLTEYIYNTYRNKFTVATYAVNSITDKLYKVSETPDGTAPRKASYRKELEMDVESLFISTQKGKYKESVMTLFVTDDTQPEEGVVPTWVKQCFSHYLAKSVITAETE